MIRRKLLIVTCAVAAGYGFALLIGFLLSAYNADLYKVYKDLSALVIAAPAAYLAYCFQRRTEYMKTLRDLWLHMINAVQKAIQYTYNPNPSRDSYEEVLFELSKNVKKEEDSTQDLYPYEPLKIIRDEILELGFQGVTVDRQKEARKQITTQWRKELIIEFLKEFDRDFPTNPKTISDR